MKERLQKLISRAGRMSRRRAEEAIRDGKVEINDRIAQLGEGADPQVDQIRVNGELLDFGTARLTLMLNKPCGYLCSMKDPQGRRLVGDLLPARLGRLYPVGRLDYNSEGLLLLTNDGALAQHLTHPRHHVAKTYLVKVRGHLDESSSARMERGIDLEDGMTAPARVAAVRFAGRNSWFELTLHEGRNRQVRRMCEALGLPVIRLKRIALGDLQLGDLKSGGYRPLSARELGDLKKIAGL